jgi:hypothetical protein
VTHLCRSVAAATTVWILGGLSTLSGQASGTVDAGSSWVNYDGFLGSGAMFVSPTLRYDTPNTSLGASGSYVLFESGRHIVQGLAAGAWRTSLHDGVRGEISGSAGVNVYDNNPGYGHLLGRARLHFVGVLSGAWVGGATGQSYEGSSSTTPYEMELGGWTVYEGVAMGAIATRTWDAATEYVDLVGTVRWRDEYLELDGSLGVRGLSDGGGEGFYGEIHAQVPIWKRISALVSAGRYPSDPVRGVIAANYVSMSLRVDAFNSLTSQSPTPLRTLYRELERPGKPEAGEARLTIQTSLQDLHSIRVEAPDVRSVEMTADFTDWQPVALRRVDRDIWEVTVRVTSGVHRVNVRLNGGPWIVPRGLRAEADEFGGSVGVLVVR